MKTLFSFPIGQVDNNLLYGQEFPNCLSLTEAQQSVDHLPRTARECLVLGVLC